MTAFATYNRIFLGMIAALLVGAGTMMAYMEVPTGELTRLGGYLENDFGWNAPQEGFPSPLFKSAARLEEYDRYYDVVVVGDSFSDDLVRGWQNYLVARTGWSLISFNMNQVPLSDVLRATTYQRSPPKLLIYESVERNIITRHPECPDTAYSPDKDPATRIPAVRSMGVQPVYTDRVRRALDAETLDPSRVFNYAKKALARTVLRRNVTEVHKFDLDAAALFSNEDSSSMLVITRDFKLKGVSQAQIETAKCDLLNIQRKVESTGRTAFVSMIFPDKTSVYARHLSDPRYSNMSIASKFENTEELNIAKVKERFDAAIDGGIVDLYLPNDTHCGFYGYRLAAHAVLEVVAPGTVTTQTSRAVR
jgi:hypothetical protein